MNNTAYSSAKAKGYVLHERLGDGAFGVVFRAEKNEKQFAVKAADKRQNGKLISMK